jgi:adenylate kinase family enzyme
MTERLLERGKTSGRSDDNEETIKKRLATDAEITQPVIDYFKSIGKLRVVDANRPINDVFSDIKIHFDNANAH